MRDQYLFVVLLLVSSNGFPYVKAQSSPCQGLFFGQVVANPERCDAYYTCVLGIAIPGTCGSFEVFDPEFRRCVPGDPSTCENGTITNPPPTTTVPTTITTEGPPPPPSLDEICENVFFGARPYPTSISLFVGCIRNSGVVFQCMENEYFAIAVNECISFPGGESTTQGIGTEIPTVPDTTTVTTTVTERTTTPVPIIEGLCVGKFNENIAHPKACFLYIYCYQEFEIEKMCSQFEIFDKSIGECRPGDHDSCMFFTFPTQPTIPSADTTEPDEKSTVEVEVTTEFFESTTNVVEVETTTAAVEITTQEVESTTNAVEITTQEVDTTTFNPCSGQPNGNIKDEKSCTQHFRCLMGRFVVVVCEAGHVVHPETITCVEGDQSTCAVA